MILSTDHLVYAQPKLMMPYHHFYEVQITIDIPFQENRVNSAPSKPPVLHLENPLQCLIYPFLCLNSQEKDMPQASSFYQKYFLMCYMHFLNKLMLLRTPP